MKEQEILEAYEGLSRVELITQLLICRAKLKIEKAQSEWLDVLADELRDGDETSESIELYEDFDRVQDEQRDRLMNKYGIDL